MVIKGLIPYYDVVLSGICDVFCETVTATVSHTGGDSYTPILNGITVVN